MRRDDIWRAVGSAINVLLSATLVALVTTLGVPLEARADPLTADVAAGEDIALSWATLGLPDRITLVGANTNQDFTLPVPTGLNVRRLRGLIHAPVDFGAGFVEISDGTGRFLATVDLPAVAPTQAVVPFDVDLSAAQTSGSAAGLSFTVREAAIPPEQRCGLGEQVVLSDLVTVFAGNEPAPTSIATFLPPILSRLLIYAPSDADGAEQQAVLTLVSAISRTYKAQSTAVTVLEQPRGAAPPPALQFTRAIVVERGDAGLAVVNAGRPDVYLKLTGRGDQLTDQASLVVNGLDSLVQVPTARVDKAGSRGDSDGDEMSFGQLRLSGESQVLRTSKLTVGVDRSALGAGRVDGVRAHLLATYTPVSTMDTASLMVNVDGHAVYTAALNDSGRVDATFDVPGQFLGQRIIVDFDVAFSPRQPCNPTMAPMTFQLDPRSTLTVRRGGPAAGGFTAVPSEFSPEFLVALDGANPDELGYAARVVAQMARLTGSTLTPRVVDVMAAADATTGALIVANPAALKPTSLRPPMGGDGSDVRIDLPVELRADIDRGLGSIQAFADTPRGRTVVLVTTTGAWSLLEPVLDYVDQRPDGWAGLDGDVLAAGPEGTVTDLSIGSDGVASESTRDSAGGPAWVPIGAGCVALMVLALGTVLWWRRRRRGPAPVEESPAPPQR